jgi:hypothetical protein
LGGVRGLQTSPKYKSQKEAGHCAGSVNPRFFLAFALFVFTSIKTNMRLKMRIANF